jgi:hypothetical protein
MWGIGRLVCLRFGSKRTGEAMLGMLVCEMEEVARWMKIREGN